MKQSPKFCPVLRVPEDIAENGIKFRLMSTLQHMAAVKIASLLWTTKGIRNEVKEWLETKSKTVSYADFVLFSATVQIKVDELRTLPAIFNSHLKYVVSRLATEIFNWISSQARLDASFDAWSYIHLIQWTSRGRIDACRTAELLMSMDCVNESYKSKAIRYYCFSFSGEEILRQASRNISNQAFFDYSHRFIEACKMKDFLSIDGYSNSTYTLIMNKEPRVLKSIEGPKFSSLMYFLSESATKRLWISFSEETKRDILNKFEHVQMYLWKADILLFVISQINEEKQKNFFWDPKKIGLSTPFLKSHFCSNMLPIIYKDWLWQDYFVPIFKKTFLDIPQPMDMSSLLIQIRPTFKDDFYSMRSRETILHILSLLNKWQTFIRSQVQIEVIASIMESLFCHENKDLVGLLISRIPPGKKNALLDILLHKISTELSCFPYNCCDQLQLLKFAVTQIFATQEIEDLFLKKNNCFNLIMFFVRECQLEALQFFIDIFLKNQSKIAYLKNRIILELVLIDFSRTLITNTHEACNDMLSFIFSGNEKRIRVYKSDHIFYRVSAYNLSRFVNSKNDLAGLEEFFNYCFGQKEGVRIGKELMREDPTKLKDVILYLLSFKNKRLIESLLDWCYADKEEKENFRRTRLETVNSYKLYQILWKLHSLTDTR